MENIKKKIRIMIKTEMENKIKLFVIKLSTGNDHNNVICVLFILNVMLLWRMQCCLYILWLFTLHFDLTGQFS